MKLQAMTLVDTGDTIEIISHNIDKPLTKGQFVFLKNALSCVGITSMGPTTPVNVMTIVHDDNSFKFMCYHMDGTTSSGFHTSALSFLMEAALFAEKKLKKKKEQYPKFMQGWDLD